MIKTIAIKNYRSLLSLSVPLTRLNVVTGANGSGKSNLYKALNLLASTSRGALINDLAKQGGLQSVLWAGPENISRDMKAGRKNIEGTVRKNVVRLGLGFTTENFGYAVMLGLPRPDATTMFNLDPEIKRECIWAGDFYRPASCLLDRNAGLVKIKKGRQWQSYANGLSSYTSILDEFADAKHAPEIYTIRNKINSWRFYDNFRTDQESIIRIPQIGTHSPVLDQDGSNLAAALRTIIEIGDVERLNNAIDDAFPGASICITQNENCQFTLEFNQPGLLRPLTQQELSDGTLRYLLLVAALLTPRPPELMVLNEPETSLHRDLLPALGRLIIDASQYSQLWVVSHAPRLVAALEGEHDCHSIHLEKEFGQTMIKDQGLLDEPPWYWPN